MSIIDKIMARATRVMENIAMTFIVIMIVIISVQVFSRYVLGTTPRWSEELAMLMMVWFAFLGIAIGVRERIHLSIEYFVSLLPIVVQHRIIAMNDLIVAVFGLGLTWYGIRLMQVTMNSRMPALQISTSFQYVMAPIAGVFITLFSLINMVKMLQKRNHTLQEYTQEMEVL